MRKVKVLQIVGDPFGGIRKHVHDILKGLHSDFDFIYVSSKNGDKIFVEEIDDLSKKIESYYALDIKKRPSVSDLANIYKIYKILKKHKVDVVHGHGAKGGLYARVAGKLAGCKVIYTPHGGVVHSMFKPFEAKLYKAVEKFLCIFTDLLIFESNYTANSFNEKFGCKKVKKIVNYNGVEIPPGLPKKEIKSQNSWPKKIGVFGMMREEKGQDLAYAAIKTLVQEGYQLELHFYGDGPLKKKLEECSTSDQLTEQVYFHGEVTNVYEKMLEMDFILIPSRFESFGYVAVEAAMLGLPVVAARVGGLLETVGDSKLMFNSADEFDIMQKLKLVLTLDESEIRTQLLVLKKSATEKFSVKVMREKVLEKYVV